MLTVRAKQTAIRQAEVEAKWGRAVTEDCAPRLPTSRFWYDRRRRIVRKRPPLGVQVAIVLAFWIVVILCFIADYSKHHGHW
jgi:hypothetical protein